MYTVDDDCPIAQLVEAFTGQDAVVSALPGGQTSSSQCMIDAAIQAGVKRFIPTEFSSNTCAAARELVPLYAEKAKVITYLKSQEGTGLTWTSIYIGQFFDWGLETGWFDYDLKNKKATIYDSGNKAWSTTTLETASAAVVKVLLKPEQTKNRPVFVASFTLSQRQLLETLEKATGTTWEVERTSSEETLKKAKELDRQGNSEALNLFIRVLLYGDDADRGANFEKNGLLDNKLLELPVENLTEVVEKIVKRQVS